LTAAEKLVLLRLADRADTDDGTCFPAHKRISKDCDVSLRTVGIVLTSLAAAGHITIVEDTGRAPKGGVRYSFIVHPLTPAVTHEENAPVTQALCDIDTGN